KNAVTVEFDGPANYPDVRILEYSGLDPANPLDTAAGTAGVGITSSSGDLNANASDLLVAANTVQHTTTGPGSGFTQRIITPDQDIVEDRFVTTEGSYNGSAPLNLQGGWVMQMVAFRAAGSQTPARPLAYIQGNYAVPQSAQLAVSVSYTAAQTAGNLNVV